MLPMNSTKQLQNLSATSVGRLGAIVQLLIAGIIAIPTLIMATDSPDSAARAVALAITYGMPGVVAYIGAVRRSRALLFAAALADLPASILSVVTLVFLIPAALLALAGAGMRAQGVSAANLVRGLTTTAVLASLLIGAGASGLLITDERCWITYDSGAIVPAPYTTGEITVPPGASSVSCSTGALSARGTALGAALEGAALALALAATARRRKVAAGD